MEKFWSDLLTALLPVLIPVLVAGIPTLAASLVALGVQYFRLLEAKIQAQNPTLTEKIKDASVVAVQVAEQLGISNVIADKKAYAIQYLQDWADKNKIKLNAKELSDNIEAAVFVVFTSDKLWNSTIPTTTTTVVNNNTGEPPVTTTVTSVPTNVAVATPVDPNVG